MHRKFHLKGAPTFLIILLVSAFFAALPTPKVYAEVSISELSKDEGFVGDLVNLTGQINTINGTYEILFDGTTVKSGNATLITVEDVFPVPSSTFGNHQIQLRDVLNATESTVSNFTVNTKYIVKAITPQAPKQLQEGVNVTLLAEITGGDANKTSRASITVQDPANITYSSPEFLIQTDQFGYGSISKIYPVDFGGDANTFFIGVYNMSLIDTLNATLASVTFTVGLTDALEYHRFQTVYIQAANYTSVEFLTIKITHPNGTVELTPSNASGSIGIITANWTIPANASIGLYRVDVKDTKPLGTEKPVADSQNFTVVSKSFACEVKTFNLDKEPVKGILVEAWNVTSPPIVRNETTNEEGVTVFLLEAANYTFKAFWNPSDGPKAEVGETSWISLAGNLTGDSAVNITCSLAHIKVAVKGVEGMVLPFVGTRVNFTYISRLNIPITPTPLFSETNITGISIFQNMFTNISYTIQANRYTYIFDTATINLTSTSWLNITCPTYELIINVYDRNGSGLQDAQVKVYEWSIGLSGLVGIENTGANGEVAFNSTFGKYIVDVYKDEILLNQTTILLINQPTTLAVYCRLYNLTLDINVLDFFGQGIPNANVTIEREGTVLLSLNTGAGGGAQFTNLVGGNYKIFVYISEKPCEITTLYLQESRTTTLKIGGIVSIGGFITETSLFITAVFMSLLIAIFLLAFIYRRVKSTAKKE
ncbi:hypothetical protein KAU88_01920 [Candidatus Bathyarchaeota archaeon]|nr:hypothetical protein [Candidatus Bathyarchaeota archaeon]